MLFGQPSPSSSDIRRSAGRSGPACAGSSCDGSRTNSSTTQDNFFGTRALLEEGDGAFQRHPGLRDADHSVCISVQRRNFSLTETSLARSGDGCYHAIILG